MKKTISLVLGLAFVFGASISLSEASRDAYHAYVNGYSKFSTYRGSETWSSNQAYSEREGLYYRIPQSHQDYYTDVLKTEIPSKYVQGRVEYQADKNYFGGQLLPYRPNTDRLNGLTMNAENSYRLSISFPKIVDVFGSLITHEGDDFSIQLPSGWKGTREDSQTFKSVDSDFEIRVVKYDAGVCEDSLSFVFCSAKISKNENRIAGGGDLMVTSKIVRQSRYSDTVLNDLHVQAPVWEESFAARIFNVSSDRYISRYFVQDLDGGVYLVETSSDLRFASKYVGVSKRIFDSFRIYQD
ncbi:MAG: hypothetical protein OEL89_05175 [Candidatus Peregrinibacteria bacterium]|nr:hypothetical protein [Candidatus Peregrinibacteria bacterium]